MNALPALALLAGLQSAAPVTDIDPSYDPLNAMHEVADPLDFTVQPDAERPLPIRVYRPETTEPAPLVLFSHGLGGSRTGSAYLGQHWAARGYVCVFLQHPGSDESVWKGVPLRRRMQALKDAAGAPQFLQRVEDVPNVMDQLETWNGDDTHPLHGRIDFEHVGMAGHSFGAVTTQAVSGQALPRRGPVFTDPRIDAALALSPSPPERIDLDTAFGVVKVPWMLMTGTHDESPIRNLAPADRRKVFSHLPKTVARYELVLARAEHSAFSGRPLPGDREPRNPNHHRAVLALSTAFWDTHLRGDQKASAWLHTENARSVLEPDDEWRLAKATPVGAVDEGS